MPMSPADRVTPSDAVVTRVVEGATVLLDTDTGRYFTLDDVGGRAWATLIASPSIQDARDVLLEEFDVEPDELMRDLEALVVTLEARGLVHVGRG